MWNSKSKLARVCTSRWFFYSYFHNFKWGIASESWIETILIIYDPNFQKKWVMKKKRTTKKKYVPADLIPTPSSWFIFRCLSRNSFMMWSPQMWHSTIESAVSTLFDEFSLFLSCSSETSKDRILCLKFSLNSLRFFCHERNGHKND